jgi:hypothetical protein
MSERDVFALASRADIVEARGKILANVLGQGKTKLMVAIGPVAGRLADALALPAGITLLKLSSADGEAHVAEWSRAVQQATQALGSTPVSTYRGQLTTIAREDLPVHSRWWMGSSGTRASRGDKQVGSAFVTNGDYYKVWAPKWVTRLRPRDLDQSMLAYLASALPNLGRSVGEGGGIVSAESYFAWEDNDRFASSDDWEYYSNDVYGRTLEELNEFLADRARGGRSGDALEGIFLPGRVAGSVILEEDTSY